MSVVIKGMQMPNDCKECQLKEYVESTGVYRCIFSKTLVYGFGRKYDCPLVDLKSRIQEIINNIQVALNTEEGNRK